MDAVNRCPRVRRGGQAHTDPHSTHPAPKSARGVIRQRGGAEDVDNEAPVDGFYNRLCPEAVEATVTNAGMPDLAVGLIRTRDASDRPAEEGVGILPHVAEVTATIANVGDAIADETTTRFWVRGDDIDRELRVVHTPELLPGDEIEVTALWDVRDGPGAYTIIVTADAFSQIDEVRKDNNSATAHVTVRGTRVELA